MIKSSKSSPFSNEMYRLGYQNDHKKILPAFRQFLAITYTCSMADVKNNWKRVAQRIGRKYRPLLIDRVATCREI